MRHQDFLHGLVKLGGTVMYNMAAEEVEEQFYFERGPATEDEGMVIRAITQSAGAGKTVRLTRTVPEDVILGAFDRVRRKLDHEVSVIAWSEGSKRYAALAATRGTATAVRLPADLVLPIFQRRVAAGLKTNVLALHNHTKNPLRRFIARAIETEMGPSDADRQAMMTWSKLAPELKMKFFLFEGRYFREIKVPDAETAITMLAGIVDAVFGGSARGATDSRIEPRT